ncbi:MAG: SDR family NAD(P)-dependent oxidoreductase [Ferruginibacter sp.]
MTLKEKYGSLAMVAGASEGIGAAYATYLASSGINLILVARRKEPLELLGNELINRYKIIVSCICCDLANDDATQQLEQAVGGKQIDFLVYNAALSYIGPFEKNSLLHHNALAKANMVTPMNLVQVFGEQMLKRQKGAIIIMASLAGFQGSGFLAAYAASKAFNRVLAESLWYEWKNRGVDIIACCAGATSTPNFIKTKPEKADFFAPRVQSPDEVVAECFKKLGKTPSFVTGKGNKIASLIMKLMPRKMAINIMGNTTRKMYRL